MSIDPRLILLQNDVAEALDAAAEQYDSHDVARVLLAPDGRLWPLLRALGRMAADYADEAYHPDSPAWRRAALGFLAKRGIDGPLADACLAAAEVER